MKRYFFIFITLIYMSATYAEDIHTRLSKNKIDLNESFLVEFISHKRNREKPDFSPLTKDFDVLSTSTGLSTTIINGEVSEEVKWTVTLMAKQEGKFIIPAITFGQNSSLPLNIQVSASVTPLNEEAIFIETEIKPDAAVYEQTPIVYIVRLFYSVQVVQGTLSDVKVNDKDAIIEQIGNETQFELHRNGKRYMVVERQFSVIPQHAGELVFSPTVFEGSIAVGNHSFFNLQTVIKRIYSLEKKIEVKKAPFQKNWFPANDVQLTEEWSKDPGTLNMGEPVTWSITIKASGNFGNQIPDIALNLPKNLKHYLDKPEITNQQTADGFYGTKQIKIALIPSKEGEFQLPEIHVEWWNLKSDKKETAVLPPRTIQVINEEIAMETEIAEHKLVMNEEIVNENLNELSKPMDGNYKLLRLLGGGIAIFTISALILMRLNTKPREKKEDTIKQIKKKLKKACYANDAKASEMYILKLMSKLYPEKKTINLVTIKEHAPENLKAALSDLYQALYGRKSNWEGGGLWQAFSSFKPFKTVCKQAEIKQPLRELYPN